MLLMPDLTSQEKTEALEKLETSLIILADTLTVPYVRVACLNQGSLEIIGTNPSQKNIPLSEGLLPSNNLFCKHVIQTGKFLKVSNAPKNIKWKNSTEVRKGITSYFGMPLFSQDGKVLGTFCIFDSKENDFSNDPLILQFKTLIEMHLVPLLKALETEENKQLDLVSLNRALENKRRKLSTLISNLPGIVYRCANDPNWTMEYINGDCFNLTGYHQGDIENNRKLSFADLIHPDDQGQVWEKVQKAIKNKSPFKLIYKIICKDGTEKWLWEQGRGVFSKEGNLIALEGFITDITEQKKNEMKLEKYRHHLESRVKERTTELEISTAQLKRSNEALNEFASIASHDLKEPLRKIVTFSLHIQSHSDQMDEKCNNYFDRIIKASERMGQFIDDLLEYSQVSSKSRPFHIVDLKSIIQDALIDLESRIHKTKAIIHISDIPPLEADGMQMKQLFQNLLSNSLKFSRKDRTPKIEIEALQNKEAMVEIVIKDNGIGFEQKYSTRIFKPFERLHGKSEYEGTGIGLALCKKIVERHLGNISINSSEGHGTSIQIKLPALQTCPPEEFEKAPGKTNLEVVTQSLAQPIKRASIYQINS